ncbi:Oxygen sensor histidine kinase nreB [Myroides odoratimimus]|uniref:sensor histidine kinase n=1 Tax=Myroides odoratimimus TaxID=76832 RepID=UPI000DFB07B6|nr:ATP-binding protein [Myroides odoratimimus]STZ49456.1 Oxygen sensor histidine kinase nreB [Myroides odoratimimus]
MENEIKLFFWLGTFIMISLVIIVIILVIVYQKNLSKYHNEQLKQQLRNSLIVEHKERARIAKELHDGLCGDLAALKNYVGVIELSQDKDLIKSTISDIQQSILLCYDEAVRVSYNLSPPLIKDNPISIILSNYLTRISRATSIKMSFKSDKQTFILSELVRLELYRIIQELIQNIIKHSKATYTVLELKWTEDQLVLSITDDGIRYDFNADLKGQDVGLGLSNIKTRVQQIKADFTHQRQQEVNITTLKINNKYEN